jgi:hypothetical protein
MQTIPPHGQSTTETPYTRALGEAREQLKLQHPTWDFSKPEYEAALPRLAIYHPQLRPRILHAAMVTVLQQSNIPAEWIESAPKPDFPPLPKVKHVNDKVNAQQLGGGDCGGARGVDTRTTDWHAKGIQRSDLTVCTPKVSLVLVPSHFEPPTRLTLGTVERALAT